MCRAGADEHAIGGVFVSPCGRGRCYRSVDLVSAIRRGVRLTLYGGTVITLVLHCPYAKGLILYAMARPLKASNTPGAECVS